MPDVLSVAHVLPAGILAALALTPAATQQPQNPSPMVEHTRAHPRLPQESPPGRRETLEIGTLFLPANLNLKSPTPLLVFFHGGSLLPEVAVARDHLAVISVQIGQGSGVYAQAFADPQRFLRLLQEAETKSGVRFGPVALGAWSAGNGAIREILSCQMPTCA